MARTFLPPGFRFHPTDEELIVYYLKRKVMGKKLHFEAIGELNIYKFGPWDLPDESLLKSKDLEWFFFCPREKKYASGARTNRITKDGYWKVTGENRHVKYKQRTVGMIKTLVFHEGRAPKGKRTDWVMHEYSIEDINLGDVVQEYMLCKVFHKSGRGPKNGAQYGAPFNEEDWSDVEEICPESSPVDGWAPFHVLASNMNNSAALNLTVPGSSCSHSISKPGPSTAGPSNFDMSYMPAEEYIGASFDILTEDSTMIPIENSFAEKFKVASNDKSIEDLPYLDGNENEFDNDLGDMINLEELMDAAFNNQDVGYTQKPMFLGDDSAYMELNDLNIPLRCPAEASEFELVQTGNTYAHHTPYRNLDGSYCEGNYTSAVQYVSELNQHSVLLEGSHNLEVARKENGFGNFEAQENGFGSFEGQENGFGNFEAYGVDDVTCNEIPVSCIQPEGSSFTEQIQRRGEQETKPLSRLQLLLESIYAQPASAAELPVYHLIRSEKLNDNICYGGSSIHSKAEVTLKVGECTKDALSHCLVESTCMCIIYWGKVPPPIGGGDLRKKVTYYYCHGLTCVFYFVIISVEWVFMLATVHFVDMNICQISLILSLCFIYRNLSGGGVYFDACFKWEYFT